MLRCTIFCFVVLLTTGCTLPAMAQMSRRAKMQQKDSVFWHTPVPVGRWIVSFNPLGLMEWPGTAGLGIGYRLNQRVELWSESSFIGAGLYNYLGYGSGFKQVLQAKFFFKKMPNLFWAVETRYKSFQTDDTGRFANKATHDTLYSQSSFAHHYLWGGALQLGLRMPLNKNGRIQLEFTLGVGLRHYVHDWPGVPPGYKLAPYKSIDLNINDWIYDTPNVYFPGSARLIWSFGKRLRH